MSGVRYMLGKESFLEQCCELEKLRQISNVMAPYFFELAMLTKKADR